MAQLVFTRAEMDKVKALFDAVKSNGQALAVVDKTLEMAERCRGALAARDTAYTNQAAKDLSDMSKQVRDLRPNLAGSPTVPVGQTWSGSLRGKTLNLWNYVRIVEMGMPPGEELGDDFGTALSSAVSDLPKTIDSAAKVAVAVSKKVVNTAVATAKDVGVAVGGAAGSIAWAALKPLIPLILLVGVGAGAYLYATKKGLL